MVVPPICPPPLARSDDLVVIAHLQGCYPYPIMIIVTIVSVYPPPPLSDFFRAGGAPCHP